VDATARLCVMNLYLHGIDPDDSPIKVADSLRSDTGDRGAEIVESREERVEGIAAGCAKGFAADGVRDGFVAPAANSS
jgi:hypothetical protein